MQMLIAILLSFKDMPNKYSESIGVSTSSAAVAFFFTYMLIFGATANCIPWVYVPGKKALAVAGYIEETLTSSISFQKSCRCTLVPRAQLSAYLRTGYG